MFCRRNGKYPAIGATVSRLSQRARVHPGCGRRGHCVCAHETRDEPLQRADHPKSSRALRVVCQSRSGPESKPLRARVHPVHIDASAHHQLSAGPEQRAPVSVQSPNTRQQLHTTTRTACCCRCYCWLAPLSRRLLVDARQPDLLAIDLGLSSTPACSEGACSRAASLLIPSTTTSCISRLHVRPSLPTSERLWSHSPQTPAPATQRPPVELFLVFRPLTSKAHRTFPHRPPSPARAAPYDSNNAHQRPHARPRLSLCSSGTAPTLSAILRLHPPPAPLHAGAVARDAPTEAFKTPEHRCPSPPATPIPVVRRCLAAQATPAAESLATTRWA